MPFYLAPDPDDTTPDKGIVVRHPGMDETEFVKLRSALTDAVLDEARDAEAATTKGKDSAYKVALIRGMVLDWKIIDAKTKSLVPCTVEGIRRLPPQVKNWLVSEISRSDGSTVGLTEVEINGEVVSFRGAA